MEIQELPGITRFIPKILLAVTVTVCDEVYKKIAYWLNDMGRKPAGGELSRIKLRFFLRNLFVPNGLPLFTQRTTGLRVPMRTI